MACKLNTVIDALRTQAATKDIVTNILNYDDVVSRYKALGNPSKADTTNYDNYIAEYKAFISNGKYSEFNKAAKLVKTFKGLSAPKKPTKKAPKESKGTTSSVKDTKVTGTKFVQDYLDLNIDDMPIEELFINLHKEVGIRNETDVVLKAVAKKRGAIQAKIDSKLNEGKLTDEQKDKLTARITELLNRKMELQEEISNMDYNISEINAELNKTNAISRELYELYKERDALNTKWRRTQKVINVQYNKAKELINKYNKYRKNDTTDTNGELKFKYLKSDTYNTILHKLQSHINALEKSNKMLLSIRISVAKGLKAIVEKIVTAHYKYTNALSDKASIKARQSQIAERIAELNKDTERIAGKNWRSVRKNLKEYKSELRDKFSDISAINKELKPLQDIKKGITEVTKILNTRHHNGNGVRVTDPATGKPVKKTTDMLLSTMVTTGTPTSELAATPITMDDIAEIFNTNNDEFANLENSSHLQNLSKIELAKFPYKMLMRNTDGSLNTNVAAAIRIALEKYILENAAALDQLSPKDLASMYGVKEEDVFALLDDNMINGGIPQYYMSSSIGADIMSMLGIRPISIRDKNGKITNDKTEFYEKLSAALGQVAILHGRDIGLLREVNINANDVNKATLYTYKLNDNSRKDLLNFQIGQRKFIERMESKFGVEPIAKPEIHTSPIGREAEDITKRNEPLSKPSTVVAESIVKAENTAWQPTTSVVLELLNMPRKALEKIEGWKDPEEEGLTAEQKISRIGKNRQIQRNIENLEAVKDKIDEGVEDIYFKWFVASNSRQFIDAEGGFNPQGIKLHRYAATMKGMRGIVDPKGNSIRETIFKIGLAQGLGFSVDKENIADSEEFAEAILGSKKAVKAIRDNINEGNAEVTLRLKGKEYHIEIEEIAHAVLALTEADKWQSSNGKPFETSMVMEVDGLTNGFAHKIMQFLATSNLGDSIDDATVAWLAKVGISFNSKEAAQDMVTKIRNGKDGKAGGIVDAYLTLAGQLAPEAQDGIGNDDAILAQLEQRMIDQDEEANAKGSDKATSNALDKLAKARLKRFGTTDKKEILSKAKAMLGMMGALRDEEGNLTKDARNLMKPPFMTFGYAAGFESMSNNITSALIDDIMNEVMNEPNSDKVQALLDAMGATGRDKARITKELATKRYGGITINGNSLLTHIRGMILGVYGDTVADVMSSQFGGIREMNSGILEGSDLIYNIFKISYDAEVEARGIKGVPNKEVHDEIIETLRSRKLLPLVRGPVSDGYDQGVAMYGTKPDNSAPNNFGNPEVDLGSKTDARGKKVFNVRHVAYKRRGYDMPGASGVVALTNIEDSLNTANAVNKHDVLQVFDAFVIGVNQEAVVSEANKDFIEMNMDPNWSQLGAVTEAMHNMTHALNKYYPGMADKLAKKLQEELTEALGFETDLETIDSINSRINSMNTKAENRRKELRTKTIVGEQIVLDKDHGFEYNGGKVMAAEVADSFKVYTKTEPTIIVSNIRNSLNDILNNC